MVSQTSITSEQRDQLIKTLRTRFEKNMNRHPHLVWEQVQAKFETNEQVLLTLSRMEETGGEPDVVELNENTGNYIFMDCSAESPAGRRSLCYDRMALDSRKEFKPGSSVLEMAAEIGIQLLSEAQYRQLQQIGKFDQKTSSWVQTPSEIRELGGAIFCDRRYDTVFTYHNGADSYYAARGFRGLLSI